MNTFFLGYKCAHLGAVALVAGLILLIASFVEVIIAFLILVASWYSDIWLRNLLNISARKYDWNVYLATRKRKLLAAQGLLCGMLNLFFFALIAFSLSNVIERLVSDETSRLYIYLQFASILLAPLLSTWLVAMLILTCLRFANLKGGETRI